LPFFSSVIFHRNDIRDDQGVNGQIARAWGTAWAL
jgi:hypothetical protein